MFGTSVATDGSTVIVGAYWASESRSGAAYLYRYSQSGWVFEEELHGLETDADRFGLSVDILGDTCIVGAYGTDIGGVRNTGATYVFEHGSTGWYQMAMLRAVPGGIEQEKFGRPVRLAHGVWAASSEALTDSAGRGILYLFEPGVESTHAARDHRSRADSSHPHLP